jgi:hypothetical protein
VGFVDATRAEALRAQVVFVADCAAEAVALEVNALAVVAFDARVDAFAVELGSGGGGGATRLGRSYLVGQVFQLELEVLREAEEIAQHDVFFLFYLFIFCCVELRQFFVAS